MRGQKFFGYVDGSILAHSALIPPPPLADPPQTNPNYDLWFEQDQLILSTLISSLSEPILNHIVGLETSHDVWTILKHMFSTTSCAQVMNTLFQLSTLKKGSLPIQEYFLKSKSVF